MHTKSIAWTDSYGNTFLAFNAKTNNMEVCNKNKYYYIPLNKFKINYDVKKFVMIINKDLIIRAITSDVYWKIKEWLNFSR